MHFSKLLSEKTQLTPEQCLKLQDFLNNIITDQISNKEFVNLFKNYCKDFLEKEFKQQYCYELFSEIFGYKNYNIVLSKQIVFSQCFKNLTKNQIFTYENIPSTLMKLDIDLAGGFSRGGITLVLGEINSGKSLFLITCGSNALRKNLKVLHVNFTDAHNIVEKRYACNLHNLKYGEKTVASIEPHNNLKIYTPDINKTMNDISKEIEDIYTNFNFDIIIVDGFMNTLSKESKDITFINFRIINSISIKYNCVALVSLNIHNKERVHIQGHPVIIGEQCSDLNLARISHTIISINFHNDINKNEMIIYLSKQRQGKKNTLYKCKTDFPRCNLIIS